MDMVQTLRELCNAPGAGGLTGAADAVEGMLKRYTDEISRDALGSVIGYRRCGKAGAPLLLLEAHLDEIGFVVTGVDDAGFVKVAACGGVDNRMLAAAEVVAWVDQPYRGVFCSVPPHLSGKEDKLPKLTERYVDFGMSSDEAKQNIPVGTRLTFSPNFTMMGDTRACSKALDDRSGCAAVLWALEQLRDELLDCDVAALFAVQEEIGARGSKVAAFAAQPDVAIITDVSFAMTPDADREKCGELGKGVMLGRSPILDTAMTEHLDRLAHELGISLQNEVMGGTTGTDADEITGTMTGIPSALLSIPERYMHTPVEVVDIRDVKAVGELMAGYAREFGKGDAR